MPGCIKVIKKPLLRHTFLKKIPPLSTSIDTQSILVPSPITIWIHGTRLLPISFFKQSFYSKPGLHHYTQLESHYRQHKIAQVLIASNSTYFCPQEFYLFGWNGKLSAQERKKAALHLYEELKLLRVNYEKQYKTKPVIRIICHSHGGNIALLLAQMNDGNDNDFYVDQLILLACPVQAQTMQYAYSSVFKKIYSFYSILDLLQIADPQGLQPEKKHYFPIFSQRLFPPHEKIEQVAITLNTRPLMHTEFVKLKFLSQIFSIIHEIDQWRELALCPQQEWCKRNKCLCLNTLPKNRIGGCIG